MCLLVLPFSKVVLWSVLMFGCKFVMGKMEMKRWVTQAQHSYTRSGFRCNRMLMLLAMLVLLKVDSPVVGVHPYISPMNTYS